MKRAGLQIMRINRDLWQSVMMNGAWRGLNNMKRTLWWSRMIRGIENESWGWKWLDDKAGAWRGLNNEAWGWRGLGYEAGAWKGQNDKRMERAWQQSTRIERDQKIKHEGGEGLTMKLDNKAWQKSTEKIEGSFTKHKDQGLSTTKQEDEEHNGQRGRNNEVDNDEVKMMIIYLIFWRLSNSLANCRIWWPVIAETTK